MRICFDTNVVLDIIARPSKYPESYISCDIANLRRFDTYIPASAITDIAYVLHRFGQSKSQVKDNLKIIYGLFDIFDVNGSDSHRAAESDMEDFEDAVIVAAAQRNGIDMIVTRDGSDFRRSPVPVISPKDFVEQFCPPDYEYDAVEFPLE